MAIIVRRLGETIEIRYHDVPIFVPAQARETVTRIARSHLALALQDLAGHIAEEAPVGVTGNLAQSFAGTLGSNVGGIEILGETFETLSGRVFSSLPYAIVMDQGREPGKRMPPVDAIMLWVERVLGIPEGDDFELEETAWAIARAISRRGIEGRQYVKRGVDAALPRIEGVFAIMGEAIAVALVDPGGSSSSGGSRPAPRVSISAPSGGVGL